MRAIWLTAHLNSFLVEELRALSKQIQVSVLSQDWLRTPHPERELFRQMRPDPICPRTVPARLSSIVRSWPQVRARSRRELADLRLVARYRQSLLRHVREQSIDVVHSHFGTPHGTGGIINGRGVAQIITLRGYEFLDVPEINYGLTQNPRYGTRLARAAKAADAVTVASARSLAKARAALGPDCRLHLIPNGADLDRFFEDGDPKAERSALGLDPDVPMILGVGHVVPVKGWEDLIRAVHDLHSAGRRLKLVIAGRTDESDEPRRLLRLVEELALADVVHFTGRLELEEVPRYYRAATMLVHPSYSEGFGNVILEAMAARRPVIATTETGAALDLIKDGESGFLVPTRRPELIAQRMRTLLDDSEQARRIGDAARQAVVHGYSLDDRAKRFKDLYQSCLDSRRR